MNVEIMNIYGGVLHTIGVVDTADNKDKAAVIECIEERKSLCGANLREMDLSEIDFGGMSYLHADFSYSDLRGAKMNQCGFENSNFYGAYFNRARIRSSWFQRCNFTNADFDAADLTNSTFDYCNMELAETSGAILHDRRVQKFFASAYRYSDAYGFSAVKLQDSGVRIIAGCRFLTFEEYESHAQMYGNSRKNRETLAILAFFRQRAIDLGYEVTAARQEAVG